MGAAWDGPRRSVGTFSSRYGTRSSSAPPAPHRSIALDVSCSVTGSQPQIPQRHRTRDIVRAPPMADLERASSLLQQVDEDRLDFSPDPSVSPDVRELTDLSSYPTSSHRANLRARIEAVVRAGNGLAESRAASDYVSRLIVDCVTLAPPVDDWGAQHRLAERRRARRGRRHQPAVSVCRNRIGPGNY